MPSDEFRTNITWKPGWYATRLHAVDSHNKHTSLCGYTFPAVLPNGEWFKRIMKRGVPKCKKCINIITSDNNFKEIANA